jgi:CheY-like chemotaxis protein
MSTSSTSLNKVNTGDLPGASASNSLQENGRNAEVIYLDPGFHVLVVDDVTSNRKLLGTLLQRRNAQVDMAVDGVDALEKVMGQDNLNHYRIIFLDNTMPNMTGIQCAEELRVRGYSNLIIGVTGNSFEEEILEFSNVGADLVLSKPMKLSQLDILLRYSHEHGFASQYIRGMNLFMDDERVIIWPRSSSNTIYQARSKIEEASKS